MAAVRIDALFVVTFFSVNFAAQPTPEGQITIQVVDTTGAVIPSGAY
jgi:hypothetical protein